MFITFVEVILNSCVYCRKNIVFYLAQQVKIFNDYWTSKIISYFIRSLQEKTVSFLKEKRVCLIFQKYHDISLIIT